MANVSLQPAGEDDLHRRSDLAGSQDGIYIVGDKSWSIDMQRYNFQFTGQRFFRIRDGKLDGQLRDVAYQATTTDFWNSMEAVGGAVDVAARRRVQLREGATRSGRRGQPRLSVGIVPRRQCAQHAVGRGALVIAAQQVVDLVLPRPRAASKTIVLVTDRAEASLRWAGNSMTTNGVSVSRSTTVISIVRQGDSAHVGSLETTEVDPAALPALVAASQAAARSAPAARDGFELLSGTSVPDDWDASVAGTGAEVFGSVAAELARGFRGPDALVRVRAPHRGDHVPGDLDGRAAALHAADRFGGDQRQTQRCQRLGRREHRGFRRRAHRRFCWPTCRPGWAGRRGRLSCRPAATRRSCRRRPSPT